VKKKHFYSPAIQVQHSKQSGGGFLDGNAPLPDKAFTTAMAHKKAL
jgi:hypothetical protein